jgi:very-short-patch-repair endonuclease
LHAQLTRQSGSRGIVRARQILKWADGAAESPMESRTRLRILDSHLPTPQVQWWVFDSAGQPIYRLDLAWPEYKVGLEYDGVDHLDRVRQRRDLERRAWLAAAGWRVLWVTDLDIYRQYDRMLRRLEQFMILPGDHAQTALSAGVSRAVSA